MGVKTLSIKHYEKNGGLGAPSLPPKNFRAFGNDDFEIIRKKRVWEAEPPRDFPPTLGDKIVLNSKQKQLTNNEGVKTTDKISRGITVLVMKFSDKSIIFTSVFLHSKNSKKI